jgi:hypothetical protein
MYLASKFQRVTVLVLVLTLWGGGRLARADAFNFSEDINKFGLQKNNIPCLPGKACAAIAAINSFIFLENQYPTIYDNKLTPNRMDNDKTDPIDATNFAVTGWQVLGKPHRDGYYDLVSRPGGANEEFVATKTDWFNDFAPGTTFFSSMFAGNGGVPTIVYLAQQIKTGEDVEFFISDAVFHVLTLTGVACDALGSCNITYLDPDDPTKPDGTPKSFNTPIAPNAANGGRLEFTYQGGTVFVSAAFSESPVPEPSTLLLVGTGCLGLLGYGWRRRRDKRD